MSKRCPECRYVNDDSRLFCASCGATLDNNLRLIQELEKPREKKDPEPAKKRRDVNFYTTRSTPQKKKSSPAPWIILGLLVVAAIAAWFFLKG